MLAIAVFLLFQTTTTRAQQSLQAVLETVHNSILLDDTPFAEITSDSWTSCSRQCTRDKRCKSANFIKSEKMCFLMNKTQRTHPLLFLKQLNAVHLHKIDSDLGALPKLAVPSCKTLSSALHPSGIYWVDVDGGSHANAFKVFCEMDTDGGGWTLVLSYTFTDYESFTDNSNAITPRPDWPVKSDMDVLDSTTPPLHETDYNAVKFSLWKQLGREFLVKSNINNWVVCLPEAGSFVEWRQGKIICKFVKRVTSTCSEVPPPSYFQISFPCGPALTRGSASTIFYYYDGCTEKAFPRPYPCGQLGNEDLKDVENLHGNIFVR